MHPLNLKAGSRRMLPIAGSTTTDDVLLFESGVEGPRPPTDDHSFDRLCVLLPWAALCCNHGPSIRKHVIGQCFSECLAELRWECMMQLCQLLLHLPCGAGYLIGDPICFSHLLLDGCHQGISPHLGLRVVLRVCGCLLGRSDGRHAHFRDGRRVVGTSSRWDLDLNIRVRGVRKQISTYLLHI